MADEFKVGCRVTSGSFSYEVLGIECGSLARIRILNSDGCRYLSELKVLKHAVDCENCAPNEEHEDGCQCAYLGHMAPCGFCTRECDRVADELACRWCAVPACGDDKCRELERYLQERCAAGANDCPEERAAVRRWYESRNAPNPCPWCGDNHADDCWNDVIDLGGLEKRIAAAQPVESWISTSSWEEW